MLLTYYVCWHLATPALQRSMDRLLALVLENVSKCLRSCGPGYAPWAVHSSSSGQIVRTTRPGVRQERSI
jgi:hypothetical protein